MKIGVKIGLATSLLAIGVATFYVYLLYSQTYDMVYAQTIEREIEHNIVKEKLKNLPEGELRLPIKNSEIQELNQLWNSFMMILAVNVLLFLLLVSFIVRWFGKPVGKLQDGVQALQNGNFNFDIDLKHPDDFGTLADTFNNMTSQLKTSFVDLEKQNKELQRINKLKDEFLANTSHELRTPINGIIGIAESLIDGAAGTVTGKVAENLNMIAFSGRRLAHLVNDILDFSKLKQEQLELQTKPVAVRELTDIVVNLSKGLIGNKSLVLVNAIESNFPAADADENRLQQILHNLIGNAIKFTDSGQVEVSAKLVNDRIEITIADTGIGIPADKLERIFESFQQADGSTSREYGGTGLGLTISKQLVELHGGEMRVESIVGKGSQFIFTLPVSKGEAAKPSLSSSLFSGYEDRKDTKNIKDIKDIKDTKDTKDITDDNFIVSKSLLDGEDGSNFTILIVDDEPVNLQVLHNYLSLQKYQISQALSGIEALKFIEEGLMPDAILLDVMMPKMSGYEVARKLREKWSEDKLPILMLTAKNQTANLVEGLESGANDYLTKPISKDELLARLKTQIRVKDLQAERLKREKAELECKMAEAVNKVITDSIQYAKIIQTSLLPNMVDVKTYLPNSFLLWLPRDIVGGDIIYAESFEEGFLLAVIDCTGHGVPGAFMTMVASTSLRRITRDEKCYEPAEILKRLNVMVKTSLQQDRESANSDDGLDAAICWIKREENTLHFAGAKLPLYYVNGEKLSIIKGDKQSLGYKSSNLAFEFSTHKVKIEAGMSFYLSTDGFVDQLGGDKGFSFGKKRFMALLQENQHLNFEKQSEKIMQAFKEYKGDNDRLDDVTVVGFGF